MILIAVPTYETVCTETFDAIWRMARGREDVEITFVKGYAVDQARNIIARKAVDGGFSHVLMLDSDIVPPADALDLLMAHGADLALGCYQRKSGKQGETAIFKPGGSYSDPFMVADLDKAVDEGRESIAARGGGFGCALVSTAAIRRLRYPWFKWLEYPNGEHLSEDLYFCTEARKEGMRILIDPRVRCGHLIRRRADL